MVLHSVRPKKAPVISVRATVDIESFLRWAHSGLMQGDRGKEYLLGRGISESQMISHDLGYIHGDYEADSSLDPGHGENCGDKEKKHVWCDSCHFRSWSSEWITPEDGGSRVQAPGRRIQGSIVFPLTSYSGVRVGFQIRHLDRKEYDTFVLRRRPEGYFFCNPMNIEAIWSTRSAILVEGPGDHLLCERLIAPNVLSLTTSAVGKYQLRFLRRFTKRLILILDQDKAGRLGSGSLIESSADDFEFIDVKYPRLYGKEKDPGDYWRRAGDEAFSRYFKQALAGVI